MIRLIFILFLLPLGGYAQRKDKTDIKKWSNAVFNTLCGTNNYTLLEANKEYRKLLTESKIDSVSAKDSVKIMANLLSQGHEITGTAIYLKDGNKKYFITAKHVLINKKRTQDNIVQLKDIKGVKNSEYIVMNWVRIATPYTSAQKGIFSKTAISLPYKEDIDKYAVFSDDTLDIAIISLQSFFSSEIIKTLDEYKVTPISTNDISDGELNIGQDILAVGYPSVSEIDTLVANSHYPYRAVFPVVTFGRIAQYDININRIIGDITIYPGNSGGPVISNNKLIGIVSAQIKLPVSLTYDNEKPTNFSSRGNLSIIQKSKYILLMLKELQHKEIE